MTTSTEIQYSLTILTKEIEENSRKLEISLIRILGYVQRLTGDTKLTGMIETVQRAIVAVKSLQIAIHALQVAAGPIGWLYAGTVVVAGGLAGYSVYESMRGS